MFTFEWNEEKNDLLKKTRGVCFQDVILAIHEGRMLAVEEHKGKAHKSQYMYIVEIRNYAYVVPFVVNTERQAHFLKTIFPDRKMTKKYIK